MLVDSFHPTVQASKPRSLRPSGPNCAPLPA